MNVSLLSKDMLKAKRKPKGNVVIGYTSNTVLMLDIDGKRQDEVLQFADEYGEFHNLGSRAVFLTSDDGQVDLFGQHVAHYCIVFGTHLDWQEIMWHISEALRLAMIKKDFVKLREFGFITIRVNAKNNQIPAPKLVYYFPNGDNRGVLAFMEYWKMCRKMGRLEHEEDKT